MKIFTSVKEFLDPCKAICVHHFVSTAVRESNLDGRQAERQRKEKDTSSEVTEHGSGLKAP